MSRITVQTTIKAPIARVWEAYNAPADIMQWNTAIDTWHCPSSSVDLREGGKFRNRMEAKDGSFGFDFEGTFTKVVTHKQLEYSFGDRNASVEFLDGADGVTIKVVFDAEDENPEEMQRGGWQAILDNFKKHVEKAAA